MKTGVVRFYNVDKKYDFIKADDRSGKTFKKSTI
jgi:cold shock CspA family protein